MAGMLYRSLPDSPSLNKQVAAEGLAADRQETLCRKHRRRKRFKVDWYIG
jgi:hypothetical protein